MYWNEIAEVLINWLFIASILAPVVIVLVRALGQWTHSQALINLADRAKIIVDALNNNHVLDNAAKKEQAMSKLATYASEVGIKVTPQQMDDYIESSVQLAKEIGNGAK